MDLQTKEQSKTNDELNKKPVVVLTGFGLFRQYKSNPSWEAIKLINENEFENVELVKIEVPVAYDHVEQIVKDIWNKYDPVLVVHCGVSCIARGMILEKRATLDLKRYCQPDVQCCLPWNQSICSDLQSSTTTTTNENSSTTLQCEVPNYLYCQLDLDRIREDGNQQYFDCETELPFFISEKAGEFLCEYIYRCSLLINPCRCLFIHVPEVSSEWDEMDISKCLQFALKSALKQILNN